MLDPLDVEVEFHIPRSSQKKQRALGAFAPYFRVGRRVYYRRATFERWIAEQEATSTEAVDASDIAATGAGSAARDIRAQDPLPARVVLTARPPPPRVTRQDKRRRSRIERCESRGSYACPSRFGSDLEDHV